MRLDVDDPRKTWPAAMLAGVDWQRNPAGAPERWPQSLRTALDICFDSRFPIIIFWGADLVQFYNEAYSAILGAKHPRAFGQRARDCFPEIWTQIEPMLHGVLESGTPTWSEDLMLPLERNGFAEECYFTFSYSPLTGENGVGGVFCAVAETTAKVLREREARERAEALAELDRAKTDFFDNISHEFRTPLTLILGPLDDALAGQRCLDDNDLDMLRRNARRLLRLVNSLLEFSRIEANRAALVRQPVDLPTLTAEIASSFRSAFESAGIAFSIDAPPLDGPVSVDPRLWEHVVLNLLSNALKFCLRGSVRLSLRREDSKLRLEVADEGGGMSEDEVARAFERFWRGSARAARSHEGSGIGLALVAEIAELHGGSARLESVEGAGTTAIVEIPYEPASAQSVAAPVTAAALALAETGVWSDAHSGPVGRAEDSALPRLLLVEDNADLRGYLTRLLSGQYRVERVPDGATALSAALAAPPDIVLSDVMMPGIDGIELVRRLRSRRATRDIPIVLLSARADEQSAAEGLRAGADDYIVKPFSSSELLPRLERHVSRARIRAEEAARFRQLADEIPQMIWTQTPDGRLDWINKRWFDYTGLSSDEEPSELRVDLVMPPDDLARFRALRAEHSTRSDGFECQVRIKPVGSPDDAYRWHLSRLTPVRDANGALVRWIGTSIDIHDGRTLAEARERDLKTLAEAIPQMVWTATPEGYNDYFNRRWAEYIGRPDRDRDADGFGRVHPDDRETAVAGWRHSLRTGEPYNAEYRLRDGSGAYHWFVVRAVAQRDETGAIVRWFGTSTNVDELKRTQEALTRSERLYRTLIETTTEGVWVLDENDVTTFVNARMAEMLGYLPEEVLGRPVWDFTNALGRSEGEAVKAKAMAGESTANDARLIRRDGTEIWVHIAASALRSDDGSIRGVLGMVHDITARKRAEAMQHLLAEASGALAQSLGLSQTVDKLLGVVVPGLATWAAIDLADPDEPFNTRGNRTAGVRHVDPAKMPATRALIARPPLTPEEREQCNDAIGECTIIAFPLALEGRLLGSITIASDGRAYDAGDMELFAEIASRTAVAIEHARLYDRERRVAFTLQAAALPKKLPNVPGLTFSAVYQAARSEALVGGDWYDAFRLSDGRIVLSIGDVMGSGLDAAVTMGAVRQAIRGAAQIYPDPVAVLNAADRALRSEQPDRIVTAFVGLLDPLTLSFTYASAGHPPPLLRADDGTVSELGGSGLPLGLREAGRSAETVRSLTLDDQSLLVLYTDGLTESTRDVFEGERRLHAALNAPAVLESAESASAIRDAVIEQSHDDVAILAVRVDDVRRRLTQRADLDAPGAHWTFDASDAVEARAVRKRIAEALQTHGVADGDICNAELLFSELVGNVMRHTSGPVEVAIDLTSEEPVLHVIDRGPGFTFHARLPNDVMSESGRGLYIAAALANELSVLPRRNGGSHARAVLPIRPGPKPARNPAG